MISRRTKQKWCNLKKVQVQVQIGKVIFKSLLRQTFTSLHTLKYSIYGFIEH